MGHGGFKSMRDSRKRYYESHKKLGLCTICSNKAVIGKTMCESHLENQREYNKRNFNKTKVKKIEIDRIIEVEEL